MLLLLSTDSANLIHCFKMLILWLQQDIKGTFSEINAYLCVCVCVCVCVCEQPLHAKQSQNAAEMNIYLCMRFVSNVNVRRESIL